MMSERDDDVASAQPGAASEMFDQANETTALSLEQEVARLRQQLQEKETELRLSTDRYLRERAELENFKKRMQREKADALRFAAETLIRDLLPIIDNLERALEHDESGGASVRDGVRMVLEALKNVLENHGVTRIDAVGQRFDPARHEALAQVESKDHEPNQVVHQHHTGYALHDRLLRPALVTVSRSRAQSSGKPEGAVESEDRNG
jgi:molecular chaperone GrpE